MTQSIGPSLFNPKLINELNNNQIGDLPKQAAKDRQQVKKVSQDFEAIFMEIMLKSMRDTVQKSGFVDGGNAEEIYRSMLDSEYSKVMSKQNTNGLASAIEKQLLSTIDQGTETSKP